MVFFYFFLVIHGIAIIYSLSRYIHVNHELHHYFFDLRRPPARGARGSTGRAGEQGMVRIKACFDYKYYMRD
jgi:hypothetical protein